MQLQFCKYIGDYQSYQPFQLEMKSQHLFDSSVNVVFGHSQSW